MKNKIRLSLIAVATITVAVTACAPAKVRLDLPYVPFLNITSSGGEVYVTRPEETPGRKDEEGYVVVGKLAAGDTEGTIVADIPLGEYVANAFTEELQRAGYTVKRVPALPSDAAKGVAIEVAEAEATARLDSGIIEADGSAEIIVAVYKKGQPVRRLSYRSGMKDASFRMKNSLPSAVVQATVRGLLAQAVPEVIKTLEGGQSQ